MLYDQGGDRYLCGYTGVDWDGEVDERKSTSRYDCSGMELAFHT